MDKPAATLERDGIVGAQAGADQSVELPAEPSSEDTPRHALAEIADTHGEGEVDLVPGRPGSRREFGMKFSFASGDRPLDGYTVKRGIGAGGFGQVYYATSDAGKEVALKHILRNLEIELRGVSQCLNLKHPNLIALYDIRYDESGEGWVVMEYVSGESLKDVVDRNPNGMPLDAVNYWISGICAGVSYLHNHGIVHRDLKPGNVFDDGGIVKIGDYGLSKFISVSRRSGQTESVGTFHYMAPEIGKGRYGKEIDIYALGIMLYEMLTGRVPFEGESSQEIIMKHLTADPEIDGVPQPYAQAVQAALAKDPSERVSSVAEFARLMGLSLSSGGMFAFAGSPAPAVPAAAGDAHVAAPPNQHIQLPKHVPPRAGQPADVLLIDDEAATAAVRQPPPQHGGIHGSPARPPAPAPQMLRPQPKPMQARLIDDEPIAAAVRGGLREIGQWWTKSHMGAFTKFVLLAVGLIVLLSNAEWLVPTIFLLVVVYLVYRAIRSMVISLQDTPASTRHPSSPQAATGNALAAHPPRQMGRHARQQRRLSAKKREEYIRVVLASKSPADRIAEVTGSMLMATFVCAVLSLVTMVVGGRSFEGSIFGWAPFYAWMTVTATFGSWAILIPAKLWEGRSDSAKSAGQNTGEQVFRRFTMLVIGLVLGAVACGLASMLLVNLSLGESTARPITGELAMQMFRSDGYPLLPAFLAYFAGMFVVLRWWRQADPLRTTRLSIWSTAGCALWAWLLQFIWPFPQPWGFMLAISISVAVQLSATWMHPDRRKELVG